MLQTFWQTLSTPPISIILLAVIFIAVVVMLILTGNTKYLKSLAYKLVCEAEEKYGSGSGSIKYEYVIASIREKIPSPLLNLISNDMLNEIIEDSVSYMKEQLQ